MWISQAPALDDVDPEGIEVEARLRADVETFARPRHIWAEARENRRVAARLASELAGIGLDVTFQGGYRNVVGLPRGERRVALVCAHYDSVPRCPGADDNASGIAVMLACARALVPDTPVGFVAFNAEEDGLLGSRDFVTNGLPTLDLDVVEAHVLEMCGYRAAVQRGPWRWMPASLARGSFIAIVSRGASNRIARQIIASSPGGVHRVGLETWQATRRFFPDLERSDHAPFWERGMPALMWTDTGNFRNPNYHRLTDTPETLDYGFMRGVFRCLTAGLRCRLNG